MNSNQSILKTIAQKFSSVTLIAILMIGCEAKPPETTPPSTVKAEPSKAAASSNSRTGKFVSVAYPVTGQATLITEGDLNILEFDADFKSAAGPDLRIVLHKAADLSTVAAPPSYGIDVADYIVVEKLKDTSGKQRYTIPKDTKLEKFKSVAVWCAKMNKTYGFAPLQ